MSISIVPSALPRVPHSDYQVARARNIIIENAAANGLAPQQRKQLRSVLDSVKNQSSCRVDTFTRLGALINDLGRRCTQPRPAALDIMAREVEAFRTKALECKPWKRPLPPVPVSVRQREASPLRVRFDPRVTAHMID